ncbi:hypothetical protein ACFFX0_30890 [Citricoccus parietis]|uniref:Uncharacterized protein n=1 Tax=Citricoccus parietis TaxID=592307 RepID=A0ABV5G8Q5_9MICC
MRCDARGVGWMQHQQRGRDFALAMVRAIMICRSRNRTVTEAMPSVVSPHPRSVLFRGARATESNFTAHS